MISFSHDEIQQERQKGYIDPKKIRYVFTDGSAYKNGSKHCVGGYGVFWGLEDPRNVSIPVLKHPVTNNICELKAILHALQNMKISFDHPIYIISDSKYCIQCFTEWYYRWKINNWKTSFGKPIKNKELIQLILAEIQRHKHRVYFKHVFSHTHKKDFFSVGNHHADQLAAAGTQQALLLINTDKKEKC